MFTNCIRDRSEKTRLADSLRRVKTQPPIRYRLGSGVGLDSRPNLREAVAT